MSSQTFRADFDTSLMGLAPASGPKRARSTSARQQVVFSTPKCRRHATYLVVAGTLLFNFMLAGLNTMAFTINANMVIASEMALLAVALGLGLHNRITLPLIVAVFVSYMFFIMMMRPGIDLKAVRDILVPIAFYFVGRNLRDIEAMDGFVKFIGVLVVAIGLFEWAALSTYLSFVRPLDYYIARGTVNAADVPDWVMESGLFASGQRYGARNILPSILGDHRVSSVFLEPVSMGNFGAILFLWALFRKGMKGRLIVFASAASVIALSDARFGMFACLAVGVALVVARAVPRPFLFALPFVIMAGLFAYGQSTISVLWDDNFSGRILWASKILHTLSWKEVMGISSNEAFVADSGYAYTLTQIGMAGLVFVWALFVFSRGPNFDAWRFRFAFGIYLCLNLIVSNSAYSIKTGAILWVMLGVADCARRSQLSKPSRNSTQLSV